MPTARVKFKPPHLGGPFKLSADYPEDTFRILSAYPIGDGLLVVLEGTMADPAAIGHLFDGIPGSREPPWEVLHVDDQTVLVQFQLSFVPPPFRAIFRSQNLPQFPYTLRDGWMVCDIATSHERLSEFRDELADTGFRFKVVSVTQSLDPIELLTDRQQQFVTAALDSGYYDSPRECSLTDLADELDVSKATASVVLHQAEERIIKEFFSESIT